jgi:hypothetical protein
VPTAQHEHDRSSAWISIIMSMSVSNGLASVLVYSTSSSTCRSAPSRSMLGSSRSSPSTARMTRTGLWMSNSILCTRPADMISLNKSTTPSIVSGRGYFSTFVLMRSDLLNVSPHLSLAALPLTKENEVLCHNRGH